MLTLGHVRDALGGPAPTGSEPPVSTVVIDSREAAAGSLFVAFPGEHVDGHDFVADAFHHGAIAALVERPVTVDVPHVAAAEAIHLDAPLCLLVPDTLAALQTLGGYWRARHELPVVGITGSVGKTSTKELVAGMLAQHMRTLKTEGNYNNEIGVPLTLLRLTPADRCAVLEMGMYALGEIARLCQLARPVIGVVTMIGPVHLERLGTLEAIVAAKQELVEALPADGYAILNRDDPRVLGMADYTDARVFTYGLDPAADLWADRVESRGLRGIALRLHHGADDMHLNVPVLGRHSVHTVLRAAAVGLVLGLGWEAIVRGLQAPHSQLRLVAVAGPRGSLLIDDTYNSSPESANAALTLLADLDGRRIAVMGDMLELGPVEEDAHRLVGRRVREVADILVAVGRRAEWLAEEALRAGMPAERVQHAPDAQAAIPLLEALVGPGDVVLLKGSRGVELDHVVTALSRTEA